jgi:WhiB family transcriptional regulator, redox-sensing transcriptional regulator
MGVFVPGELIMTERILPALAPAGRIGNRQDFSWRESAACQGADTELFFPVGVTGPAAAEIRAAKTFCGRCPVRDCCLAYALDTGQTAGIWGGYDENERRFMHQRQRRYARLGSAAAGARP